MKLDDLVTVSGISGIFKLAANRNNGLIIEDLDKGKKRFASSRKHQFTPLASIAIFTYDDSTELKVVFRTMLEQIESNPPIKTSSSSAELRDYFRKILPDYDEDKVHTSDIKKLIKWFNFLNERNLIDMEDEEVLDDVEVEVDALGEEE
ncbi:MAG TPA: hypothetical protein ENJ53_10085 [Phaeodactylibacter sp.]|nr:hypothetical protein [Phaeodactylibacter sp.]